ncbi:hypothetical protein M9H77_25389 [Catharanthus roseus]|uniref:Uncharacterized protein n=1 Tax=Catharanthus roseus TaxID=4058 RepID=A0ACC0AAS2_CATRO|nr:hypothetical protein M9H77_25389 [Catharanthus roseus]
MYEVSQNVDLSSNVDALSKKFDQLLALNTLHTNSPNIQNNLCRNKLMQLKDFTGRTTHIQIRTIQTGEIILISPRGNKKGKVNWTNKNINRENNLLETQIGQLANAINRRDEGKFPSHPIENPRANHHEQVKTIFSESYTHYSRSSFLSYC